jgi:Tfp pilus assembly protein PilX
MTLRQLRLKLSSERGFALVLALGITIVLSMTVVTVVEATASNSRSSVQARNRVSARALAEAGINLAASVIRTSTTPTYSGLLPSTTTTYDGGSVTWSGTLDDSQPNVSCPNHLACWLVTATGTVRNPYGNSSTTQTLTAKVPLDAVYSQKLVNNVYDYVFVYGTNDPDGCDFQNANNSTFGSRLYVQGNLCLSGSTSVMNEVDVWGTAVMANPSSIGQKAGSTITNNTSGVHIKGGCATSTAGPFTPWACGTAQSVYASPAADASPVTLTPPNVTSSAQGWYKNASPGPYSPCKTTSGTPSNTGNWATAFDNDVPSGSQPNSAYMNRSVTGAFDLTPTSGAYSCKSAFGELSWNPSATDSSGNTVPTLTVKGTVFIDGNARIAPSNIQLIRYVGVGTIYVSGSIVLKGTHICAAYVFASKDCDWSTPGTGHWDVSQNFLQLVAGVVGGGGQSETPDTNTSVEIASASYQGGITANLKTDVSSGSTTQGPLVQNSMNLGQSLVTKPFGTLTDVPTATPDNQIQSVKVLAPTDFSG